MYTFIAIAFIGGLLTIAAPCILAVLPIILGSTLGNQNKLRPIAIVIGLTLSFTAFGLLFNYVTTLFGLSNNTLRNIALVFLFVFALALIFPLTYEKILFRIKAFFLKIFPDRKTFSQFPQSIKKKGLLNGFLVGASLGLVWVPCAGPILGAILTLAISQTDLQKVIVLLLSYSLGAGIPMLLIAYGGNFIISKTKILKQKGVLIQKISGILLLLGVVVIMTGLDTKISVELANFFPDFNSFEQTIVDNNVSNVQNSVNANQSEQNQLIFSDNNIPISLQPKGITAPEIIGTQNWINSQPLKLADLKGKVVIVDFWTYSCINCIRTLPYISDWYQKYKDQGLVIIGVHTPEFAFEKDLANVENAVKQFNIMYPVVQDNDYKTWDNYKNRYWPAKYIIDRDGYIRYVHFGEGEYDETEKVIQTLLAEGTDKKINPTLSDLNKPQIPVVDTMGMTETGETYLGFDRGYSYGNDQQRMLNQTQTFTAPSQFENDAFYLEGDWLIQDENILLQKPKGKIIMRYQSNKINLVADKTDKPVKAKIFLDGQPLPKDKYGKDVDPDGTVTIDQASLYNLVDSHGIYEQHTLTIEFEDPTVKAYVFTFG